MYIFRAKTLEHLSQLSLCNFSSQYKFCKLPIFWCQKNFRACFRIFSCSSFLISTKPDCGEKRLLYTGSYLQLIRSKLPEKIGLESAKQQSIRCVCKFFMLFSWKPNVFFLVFFLVSGFDIEGVTVFCDTFTMSFFVTQRFKKCLH